MSVILLADNGSVRATAIVQLRSIARDLSALSANKQIHPVSLKHAARIPTEQLDGQPALTFPTFMTQKLSQGERDFILIPLFFANSKALTSFVPSELTKLHAQYGDFRFRITQVIYPLPHGEPLLTDIIYEHIFHTAQRYDLPVKNIVLVDHGSPNPHVTAVRKHLANRVQERLSIVTQLEQAVMERRKGKEYDFNGDLLLDWLINKAQSDEKSAIIILLFFLPGRHAGPGGDINEICNSVIEKFPDFTITISPLITDHPKLLSILHKRLYDIL